MSEPVFYALREDRCVAFVQRITAMLADADLGVWRKLYPCLSELRRRPYLGYDGTLCSDAQPLARFDWHLPANESHAPLTPDLLPSAESRAFRWLLMNALLQTCDYRLFIRWGKFSFGWTITVHDEGIVRSGAEQAEFELLVKTLFEHPGGLPQELGFLSEASHLHSYVRPTGVRALVEAEDGAGLLARLGSVYGSSADPITKSFGEAIVQLHHFLRIAGVDGSALFMCYYAA